MRQLDAQRDGTLAAAGTPPSDQEEALAAHAPSTAAQACAQSVQRATGLLYRDLKNLLDSVDAQQSLSLLPVTRTSDGVLG